MKVINFWAGPGAGKSTTAAGLFYLMKTAGYKVELVTEFAKELVYEKNPLLRHNVQILGEQDQRLRRLIGQVDYAITDCPLPITAVYSREPFDGKWFSDGCWALFKTYYNINVFIERVKPYQKYGREQEEHQARELDQRIKFMLSLEPHHVIRGDAEAPQKVLSLINAKELDEQIA